jgi:hypothetical protein
MNETWREGRSRGRDSCMQWILVTQNASEPPILLLKEERKEDM